MRFAFFLLVFSLSAHALPTKFDLRNVDGKSYVSAVKNQSGGTCWTHGAMAALEGNLLLTGGWQNSGQSGDANLAEYHMDWWNGFNKHFNADIAPSTGGLTVHQGGDYRVAAAYLTRGEGSVRDIDAQSYSSPPEKHKASYQYYYTRHIEWIQAGNSLENIDRIKTALMDHGVMGTALTWSNSYYNSSSKTFYQPPSSSQDPNHAVAIVGWDDEKKTGASKPGAWLIKNSWGSSWGDGGYFWISYFDKVAGQHREMGAVSFKNVEPMRYHHVYYHDYHGWRDTKTNAQEAFNAFQAKGNEYLQAVGFYTAAPDVEYMIRIHTTFENGELGNMVAFKDGHFENEGYHTVDLNFPVPLQAGQKFYVYVHLSDGGHPFDKTSDVPLLLGAKARVIVASKANAGESFYKSGGQWKDLTSDDKTANFTIKALTSDTTSVRDSEEWE